MAGIGAKVCRDGLQFGLLASIMGVVAALLAATPATAAGRAASMAIDVNTGQILHSQAADEPRYPASLTKMMTLYLVFEHMHAGRISASTRIKVSEEAASAAPSKLGLHPGDEITLIDAIRAVIVKSANDMSVALAEHIAGSEEKFAQLMTRKARQLGMSRTTFRNSHGLPDPEQQTTARDMLTLAVRLGDDFPSEFRLFSLRAAEVAGRTFRNHNTMLANYQGMDGIKTGYTRASGFNLVSSVRRNGRHVVAVVFGGSSAAARNAQMRVLLDRSLARASPNRTRVAPSRSSPTIARLEPKQRPSKSAEVVEPRLVEPPREVSRYVQGHPGPRPVEPPDTGARDPETATAQIEVQRVRTIAVTPAPAAVSTVAPFPDLRNASNSWRPASPPIPASAPASTSPPPERALAPSTLQAQAERIDRGLAPVPAWSAPTADTARRTAVGRNIVQVGAYSTEAEARRQLAAAREKSSALLGGAQATTEPVTAGKRQLWRARFVGLESSAASDVCNQLRRAQFDCLVTRTP